MNRQELQSTTRALLAPAKGLLAADESLPTSGALLVALTLGVVWKAVARRRVGGPRKVVVA